MTKQIEWNIEFLKACLNGEIDRVQSLTTDPEYLQVVDIHHNGEEGFEAACKNGHLEVVKFLTSSEKLLWAGHSLVGLSLKESYGFLWACCEGHLEIVRWLTSSEEMKRAQKASGCWAGYSNIHASQEYGFRIACEKRQVDVVRWLLFNQDYEPINQEINRWSFQEGCYQPMGWKKWLKESGYEAVLEMVNARDEQRSFKKMLIIKEKEESQDDGEPMRGVRL